MTIKGMIPLLLPGNRGSRLKTDCAVLGMSKRITTTIWHIDFGSGTSL